MSYTLAAAVGLATALVLDLVVLRTRLVTRRAFWVAEVIVLGFQLVVNGILTGRGIVRYDDQAITGLRVVHAPVEDLIFGFALALSTLAAWVAAGRTGSARNTPH